MIILNKWESQLVWLGKGWVNEDDKFNYVEALQNLWGKRQMMYPEHIELGFVAGALIDLVEKVVPNFKLRGFIDNMMPQQYGQTKYTDNKSYAERVCWVCLYNYLSILQTKEKDENGEWFHLVKLKPLELDLFINEEKEND